MSRYNDIMIIEVLHGDSVFDALAGEWDELAGRGITDTPFQSLAYQRAWWQYLQPPDSRLFTIVLREEEGKLAALASLYLMANGVIHFNGCVEETDYLDIIAPPEYAEMAWTAVFECLHSQSLPPWTTLDLCNIPEQSPSRPILYRLAEQYGCQLEESIHEVCPIIHLPQTFEDYLQSLDSKQRREIRRKLRRANGAGARLVVTGPEDDLEQAVDEFLELLQKSTFEKRDWLTDGRRAVFHAAAEAAQAAGTLQLLFMEVNGRKAAALFNFDYKNRIWVYNSGLDPYTFGNLSLGVVLTAKAIELAIENGRSTFDFLRGNETYKYRFGAIDTMIYRLQIAHKT